MDEDGPADLFPELPPRGPERSWWEVSAAFPDGQAPCPPPSYPAEEGVLAVHTARMSVIMVRAGLGSEALATAEGLLGLKSAEWRVRPAPVTAVQVSVGLDPRPRAPSTFPPESQVNAPASLERAYAMLGKAVVPVIGTGGMKERARMADAGKLADAEQLALAAEVEALARLLGGRMGP